MFKCGLHFDNKLVTHYRVDDKETQVADRLAPNLPSPQAHGALDFSESNLLRDGQALKISGIPWFGLSAWRPISFEPDTKIQRTWTQSWTSSPFIFNDTFLVLL